ncbi:cytochrome P450 [Streptomyces sp. S.PNR 29]|uniref:cytochrome P450 n=1 Tax=Streptomyces sp. S.PNR 29 TaxID=2973805 RepID=UPI0025B00433|nr:cytochrome P450 [Streptomyces sp. S.PNR 29]MDN0198925.1 cytochrome P450 [Streptomyces sp. S.PNR 29]
MTLPSSDVDLFATDTLLDPYPVYARLRDAGPVVRLSRFDAWALPRYEQVSAALRDHETFSSASGVGFADGMNELMAGGVLASDPPHHTTLRGILSRMLMPRALRDLGPSVTAAAEEIVDRLAAGAEFDAVSDLAEVFTPRFVADLIGLPEEGRDRILEFGASTFEGLGPFGERTPAAIRQQQALMDYVTTTAAKDRLAEGGLGARVWEAVDSGEIDEAAAITLMMAFLVTGMDTTILSLAAAVRLFAEHPDQWDALRADPSLVPAAYLEVLRIASPVTVFSRVTTRDWECDGVTIPAGDRVAVMFASANRDERKWDDPERFDITRKPSDHLTFGVGIHACVGQNLAKLEAHALLTALLARVRRFEIGKPEFIVNNTLHGLSKLPCRIVT